MLRLRRGCLWDLGLELIGYGLDRGLLRWLLCIGEHEVFGLFCKLLAKHAHCEDPERQDANQDGRYIGGAAA